jgi:Smg protein
MIDILVYLFANYHSFSARPKTKALKRKLSAVGFKAEAISMALHWLDGLKAATVVDLPASRDALRIYREQEQRKLGVDCLGFIAFLEASDLITPALRELVIDRAMTLDDDHVPLGKFKIIVLMVLWSHEQDLEPLVVEELLDGGDARLPH